MLVGLHLIHGLLVFTLQFIHEVFDFLFEVEVVGHLLIQNIKLLLFLFECRIGFDPVDASGHFELHLLGDFHGSEVVQGIVKGVLTDVFGKECVQFIINVVELDGDAVVDDALRLPALQYQQPQLLKIKVESLDVYSIVSQLFQLLVEILGQRVYDFASDDRVDLCFDGCNEIHLVLLLYIN